MSFHSLGKVSRKGICAIFLISPKMRLCTVEYQLHKKTNSGITKTCLYNLDPLKPHFYIVKLGFTGVCIIFLISAQNIDCEYSLEPPSAQKHRLWVLVRTAGEAVLTSTHNLCFEQKYEKYQIFLSENFMFLEVKFSIYLNRHVFVMIVPVTVFTLNIGTPLTPYHTCLWAGLFYYLLKCQHLAYWVKYSATYFLWKIRKQNKMLSAENYTQHATH